MGEKVVIPNVEQATRLAAQFALIVANRSGNQCNQRLLRFRNIYCETSESREGSDGPSVKNGLTKQQVLDVIKEVLYYSSVSVVIPRPTLNPSSQVAHPKERH
jgi:hypothetical protein